MALVECWLIKRYNEWVCNIKRRVIHSYTWLAPGSGPRPNAFSCKSGKGIHLDNTCQEGFTASLQSGDGSSEQGAEVSMPFCSAACLSKELTHIRCSKRTLKLLFPVQHLCSKNRSMQQNGLMLFRELHIWTPYIWSHTFNVPLQKLEGCRESSHHQLKIMQNSWATSCIPEQTCWLCL